MLQESPGSAKMHALGREKIAESFGEKLSLTAEMVRTGRMGAAHDVAYGDMGMGRGRVRREGGCCVAQAG